MMRNKEMDMNKELTPIGNIKDLMPICIAARKNAAKREALKIIREQMNAMDDMERDENGMTKEGAFEFRRACQAMFDAADAFEDWMNQEEKFGNK